MNDADISEEETIDKNEVKLKRQVGLIGGISLIVGTIIGSGIFISPKGVFQNAGSVGAGLLIWFACGLLSTFGALCYAELGTMIPKSGGEFPILLEAFGPIPAYLFAWTAAVILKPSSLCLLSLTFAKYALTPAYGNCDSVPELSTKFVAASLILLVVFINCFSVKLSTKVVTFFGVGKILSLVIIIIAGIVRLCQGYTESFQNSFEGPTPGIREITMAFYQGLWAFDGWNQLNYVVEELKNPYKTLPRALIASLFIVTGLYLLTNVSYFTVLSLDNLLQSPAVASGLIALLMVIPNDFDSLVNYYSFATWAFYFATSITVLYFRYKMPDRHRPVKVPIFVPIIFSASALCLVVAPIVDNPEIQYLVAVLTMLFGLVFYFPFVHFKVKSQTIRNLNIFLQKVMIVALPEDDCS